MLSPQKQSYTTKDIYQLPDGQRAELIDGAMYLMDPPSYLHQKLVSELTQAIGAHIKSHHGSCEILPAPFAVFLNNDNRNYVEPDISVVCDKNKLSERGCEGAPDFIVEIVSPSSMRMDYQIKLFKYRTAGVKEYWIVNPSTETVTVYGFEQDDHSGQYRFDQPITSVTLDGLSITLKHLLD